MLLVCVWSHAAFAVTTLSALRYSPDITVVLGNVTVTPENVAEDDLAGGVTLVNVGTVPTGTHVAAYDKLSNGDQLLAFDTDVSLPGNLTARPGDVVRFNGGTYALFFDAAANGIPLGVSTDALTVINGTDLLLSFDSTVTLGAVTVEPKDLARFDGSNFTLFFDGSAAGVPPGLNLDAAFFLDSNGDLLVSFDGSGSVGGVPFDDEDVLEFNPNTASWALAYDGSVQQTGWPPADLNGLFAAGVGGPTLTPTPSPTLPTPTASATPIGPPSVAVDLGGGVGRPGGIACVPVTLNGGGAQVAATSNDIGFASSFFSVNDGLINPNIGSGTAANKQVASSTVSPGLERVGVFGLSPAIIPDGLLYTCRFAVDASAASGTFPLSNAPGATDPGGNDLAGVGGSAGQIIVTSCTGDCNGNNSVTIGEVVKCVNLFLGQPFCNLTNPAASCPVADASNNGVVSIGEVVQCVNSFLHGCPAPSAAPALSNAAPGPPS